LTRRFLMNEISHLLVAAAPDLVVGARTRWRVPVWIGFPGGGRHEAGVVEVDAQTGAFVDQAAHVAEISARRRRCRRQSAAFCGAHGCTYDCACSRLA
jgi:hypothetical protein